MKPGAEGTIDQAWFFLKLSPKFAHLEKKYLTSRIWLLKKYSERRDDSGDLFQMAANIVFC